MEKCRRIINADLIASGKRNSTSSAMIALVIVMLAGSLYASPMFLTMITFILGSVLTTLFFASNGYHNEKLFCLLPVERKDVVRARFIFLTAVFTAVNAVIYIIGLIQVKTGFLLAAYFGAAAAEDVDILQYLTNRTDILDKTGLYNVSFAFAFAVSIIVMSHQLKAYIKDNSVYDFSAAKKIKKSDIIGAVIALIIIIIVLGDVTGILPVGKGISTVVLPVLSGMLTVANGSIFCMSAIMIAVCHVTFIWVCTELNYDSKDIQ